MTRPIRVTGTPAIRLGMRLARRRCKQKLVILATVQRQIEIDFPPADSRPRHQPGLNLGSHAALFANVRQVRGQPVTEFLLKNS